ncbi:WD repeat-containing 43-like [Brachionus plicatilis]|uniref:WD repeat-containing 43-like n=1 Tax=Brachionus plicatilis TaxID=10195 RepID=A0A3M7PQR4_BRAPC|nr:WD repeat-containing 43-like [Brachionus plicatilis]
MHRLANNIDIICSVSSNGDCIAICTPDGVIKFYDTLTSNLKLEYSASSHLQAGCSCLVWSKLKRVLNSSTANAKQKKLKTNSDLKIRSIEKELNDLDLVALGTTDGSVLIYSLSKTSLHTHLKEGGHSDKVNDICWCPNYSDSIYSCSDDGYIVEWSLIESRVKSKWKASKTAITSISIDPSNQYLICSSKTISVWNLQTKTKVKTFTGHSSDIIRMQFLSQPSEQFQYFVSAAHNDRIINSWAINKSDVSDTCTQTLQSFTLSDGPSFIDVVNVKKDEKLKDIILVALTQKGSLSIFNLDLCKIDKSNLKKPLKPLNSLKIETKEGAPLKIFAAFLADSNNQKLTTIELAKDAVSLNELLNNHYYLYVVYGSHVNPRIEKLEFSLLDEAKKVLKREDPFKSCVYLQTQSTKIESPMITKDTKVLVPGHVGPQTSTVTPSQKRKSTEPSQMSLEERLNIMGLNSAESNGESFYKNGQAPKTDNLLVLLVQGLQSNDSKMLNHILQHKNDKVITKTVRMLPTNYVVQLIKELNKRLQGHAQSGLGLIKWLKSVLMIHTSYLMSYPDLIESLGSVYEMMNARTKLFPQLSKLQGKLQLVMSQVTSQAEGLPNSNDKEPLLYYQDSSSEDEQIEDELIPSHSEFDEYVFSDEEDEEESNREDEDEQDENMTEDVDSKQIIKKPISSFKKSRDLSKNSLLKKNKKMESGDDDDHEHDKDENGEDEIDNGFGTYKSSDSDDEVDDE